MNNNAAFKSEDKQVTVTAPAPGKTHSKLVTGLVIGSRVAAAAVVIWSVASFGFNEARDLSIAMVILTLPASADYLRHRLLQKRNPHWSSAALVVGIWLAVGFGSLLLPDARTFRRAVLEFRHPGVRVRCAEEVCGPDLEKDHRRLTRRRILNFKPGDVNGRAMVEYHAIAGSDFPTQHVVISISGKCGPKQEPFSILAFARYDVGNGKTEPLLPTPAFGAAISDGEWVPILVMHPRVRTPKYGEVTTLEMRITEEGEVSLWLDGLFQGSVTSPKLPAPVTLDSADLQVEGRAQLYGYGAEAMIEEDTASRERK
ncbi:MAG: hypothetical protein K8T20_12930 [Planctomycetes bacterium]|nr:hypothetical protein [Planctomycetota bacterium]